MENEDLRLRWKDVFAISIAMFQVLAPRIITIILSLVIVMTIFKLIV